MIVSCSPKAMDKANPIHEKDIWLDMNNDNDGKGSNLSYYRPRQSI